MYTHRSLRALAFLFLCLLLPAPAIASQQADAAGQQISISDSRTGSGPCGFEVQRVLEGTVTVVTSLDGDGRLVLSVTDLNLTGTVANPANGKAVEIVLVRSNGDVAFSESGGSVDLALGLSSWFDRGYDTADTLLVLSLPADGAEVIEVAPGERYEDPWSQVCSLLA